MLVLSRRTRDRCALGVGGSYGQGDYWLGQLDPASPQEPLRCADSEPRVLKSWKKDALLTGSDHPFLGSSQKIALLLNPAIIRIDFQRLIQVSQSLFMVLHLLVE